MKISTDDLSPWADVNNMLSQMRGLTVTLDGEPLGPEADLSVDGRAHVTMAFESPKKKAKLKKVKK